jgi:NMD protein affecting ribosome stability and mRNA decay
MLKQLFPCVRFHSKLKTAAFIEDDGSMALVLQDMSTDKRITFKLAKDGRSIRVITVDEDMVASSKEMPVSDKIDWSKLGIWVTTASSP